MYINFDITFPTYQNKYYYYKKRYIDRYRY